MVENVQVRTGRAKLPCQTMSFASYVRCVSVKLGSQSTGQPNSDTTLPATVTEAGRGRPADPRPAIPGSFISHCFFLALLAADPWGPANNAISAPTGWRINKSYGYVVSLGATGNAAPHHAKIVDKQGTNVLAFDRTPVIQAMRHADRRAS